jgi:hypothetical protein
MSPRPSLPHALTESPQPNPPPGKPSRPAAPTEDTPGPGHYLGRVAGDASEAGGSEAATGLRSKRGVGGVGQVSPAAPAWTLGARWKASAVKAGSTFQQQGPGPGAYQPDALPFKPAGPAFSFTHKRPAGPQDRATSSSTTTAAASSNPGPGDYAGSCSAATATRVPRAPAFSFGSSGRDGRRDAEQLLAPAPGEYFRDGSSLVMSRGGRGGGSGGSGAAFSFGVATRETGVAGGKEGPGPGEHDARCVRTEGGQSDVHGAYLRLFADYHMFRPNQPAAAAATARRGNAPPRPSQWVRARPSIHPPPPHPMPLHCLARVTTTQQQALAAATSQLPTGPPSPSLQPSGRWTAAAVTQPAGRHRGRAPMDRRVTQWRPAAAPLSAWQAGGWGR